MMRRRNPSRPAYKPVTDSPAFQRWFGQSKVVDEQGEPLVVYHGTTSKMESGMFDPYFANTNARTDVPDAFFFSSSPSVAATYASEVGGRRYRKGANIVPAYLRLTKPLVVDLRKWGNEAPYWNEIPYRAKRWPMNDLARHAMRRGYDGLVVKNVRDVYDFDALRGASSIGDTYVAFSPYQVKSAIGNQGTFDPYDPRITHNPRRRTATRRNPAAMTDTPAFKRWFGQSKIVDAEGNPQRLYHITTGNFDVFKPGGFDPGMSGRAIWLTPYPHDIPAAHNTMDFGKKGLVYRSGASIMPLWARVENPLYILDADDAQYAERFKLDSFGFPATLSDKSIAAMKKAGHDGIVFGQWRSREGFDLATGRGVEVIVFDPNQLKSAIGNRGTFDPDDPNIRHNPRRRVRTATRRNPAKISYDVLGIHDTRDYERDATGKWKAVPGSGEHRPCDVCQHDHVVHVVLREWREPTPADLAERTPKEAEFMVRAGIKVPTGNTLVVGRDCAEQMTGQKISKTYWDAATAKAVNASRRNIRTPPATRRNPKMEEYPCSRCGGTGRLSGYGHVWGGVCFKCHGTGTQTAKPSTKAAKWAVHFPKTVERPTAIDQGDDFVYIVSAKSPDQAVLKTTTTFLGSRIRHEFTERGAWAEPYEEYMARFYAE